MCASYFFDFSNRESLWADKTIDQISNSLLPIFFFSALGQETLHVQYSASAVFLFLNCLCWFFFPSPVQHHVAASYAEGHAKVFNRNRPCKFARIMSRFWLLERCLLSRIYLSFSVALRGSRSGVFSYCSVLLRDQTRSRHWLTAVN